MQNLSKIVLVILVVLTVLIPIAWPMLTAQTTPALLDPLTIPKYVNQLTGPPPVYEPKVVKRGNKVIRHDYTVDVTEFYQQVLPPGFPMTPVWGYGGKAKDAITGESLGYIRNQPGATFEAIRGIPINVKWQNKLTSPHMFPVDPTLHWANPNDMPEPMPPYLPYPPGYEYAQSPIPLIPHHACMHA